MRILGVKLSEIDYKKACQTISELAQNGRGGYVCCANVHSLLEAYSDWQFRDTLSCASIVTADGRPLVWLMLLGKAKKARQVCGPILMPMVCNTAAKEGISVGFYGSTNKVLENLEKKLKNEIPGLTISYSYSPKFGEISTSEDDQITEDINSSGTKILFVGLGCPKQEKWMHEHRSKISAVMIGVGAAFDFISGEKKRAPYFFSKLGLEWLYRLIREPKRLWKRYILGNTIFLMIVCKELLKGRLFAKDKNV